MLEVVWWNDDATTLDLPAHAHHEFHKEDGTTKINYIWYGCYVTGHYSKPIFCNSLHSIILSWRMFKFAQIWSGLILFWGLQSAVLNFVHSTCGNTNKTPKKRQLKDRALLYQSNNQQHKGTLFTYNGKESRITAYLCRCYKLKVMFKALITSEKHLCTKWPFTDW